LLAKNKFEQRSNRGDRSGVRGDLADSIGAAEAKEPAKPSMDESHEKSLEDEKNQRPEFKKQLKDLKEKFSNEKNFMINLHKMARDIKMTNNPRKLSEMFSKEDKKSNFGILWRDEKQARDMIFNYYDRDQFYDRLVLAFNRKSKGSTQKHIGLYAFFLKLS
jgi:hypothetical protein